MTDPKNNPAQTPLKSESNLRDQDLLKAFDHPQDQYTCINLNNPKIAQAFIEGFFCKKKYFSALDLPKLKVENRQMHDDIVFKDSYADIQYTIPFNKDFDETTQVIILAEHKSYNDRWAIVQLEHYASIALYQASPKHTKSPTQAEGSEKKPRGQRFLPPIIPIIIYNGATPYSGPRRLSELYPPVDGMEKPFLDFEPIIIDLSTIDFDDLPDIPNEWRLNVVLRALKSGTMKDLDFKEVENNFQRILEHYDPKNPEEVRFVKTTVRYYMDGSHVNPKQFVPYIQENYPISDDGVKDMTMTMAEQLIQQGDQQGFERGDKQGFERGDKHGFERCFEHGLVTNRKTLLTMLERKFKYVPASVRENIQSIHDDVYLQTLFIEAMECETMDEFREKLL